MRNNGTSQKLQSRKNLQELDLFQLIWGGASKKQSLHWVGHRQEMDRRMLIQQALVTRIVHFTKKTLVLDQLLGDKF